MNSKLVKSLLMIIAIIIVMIVVGKNVAQVAKKQEQAVVAVLGQKDVLVAQLETAKELNTSIKAQDTEIQEFLSRWTPEFSRNEANAVITKVEELSVNRRVISLSPRVGQSEQIYLGTELVSATPFAFTFVSANTKPLFDLIFDIQNQFKGMRVSGVTIAKDGDSLTLKMDLFIPTKGVI